MKALEGRLQVLIHEMGVNHGCRQVAVPERLLHQANILGLPVEFSGERVSERMRMDILVLEAGLLPPPLDHGAQRTAVDGRAFERGEQQPPGVGRAPGAPAPQFLQHGFVEPEDAVLLTLALAHEELTAQPIQVMHREREDLGGPQARMEHQLHAAPIAVAGAVTRVGDPQDRGRFSGREHGRQAAGTGHGQRSLGCRWHTFLHNVSSG